MASPCLMKELEERKWGGACFIPWKSATFFLKERLAQKTAIRKLIDEFRVFSKRFQGIQVQIFPIMIEVIYAVFCCFDNCNILFGMKQILAIVSNRHRAHIGQARLPLSGLIFLDDDHSSGRMVSIFSKEVHSGGHLQCRYMNKSSMHILLYKPTENAINEGA